jgi:hypothetical protein
MALRRAAAWDLHVDERFVASPAQFARSTSVRSVRYKLFRVSDYSVWLDYGAAHIMLASVLFQPCCHLAQSQVPVTLRRPEG